MKTKIILLIIIAIILIIFYLYFENSVLSISIYKVKNKRIPKNFNNFKIAHISDFHNTTIKKLNKDLKSQIKKEKPDIIVITGDLIDSRNTKMEVAINLIKEIKKYGPVYYVPGNHESRIEKYKDFQEKLLNEGVKVLLNKTEVIEINNEKINIAGIVDPAFINNKKSNKEIINNNIKEANFNELNYTILLSHRPEYFKTYIENNIDLTLTGHAHGGQIRIPFIGGIISPGEGLFPKYTNGLHEKENKSIIISRGIGNSLFPFRINNRPELVIIELKNN